MDGVRNECDKDTKVRLVFEPKSSKVDREFFVQMLLSQTSLECNAPMNLVMIGNDGRPAQKPLQQILVECPPSPPPRRSCCSSSHSRYFSKSLEFSRISCLMSSRSRIIGKYCFNFVVLFGNRIAPLFRILFIVQQHLLMYINAHKYY